VIIMEYFKNPIILFGVFGTAVFFLTFITRRIVETAKPTWKKQADENDKKVVYISTAARWWNDVILYTLGPTFGALLALGMADTDYFPEQLKGNTLVVIMSGICLGFTCGWFYKILKRGLARGAGVKEKELDDIPDVPEVPGDE